MARWHILGLALAAVACHTRNAEPAAKAPEPAQAQAGEQRASSDHLRATPAADAMAPLAVCKAKDEDALTAARTYYEAEKYKEALSCAAEATAVFPDNAQAHSEHGAALAALGKFEDAQVAYARALALDPDQPDALLGAAHLYGVRMPSTRERDELASVYAERGLMLAEEQNDKRLVAEFALLSAMAFNDLGESADALDRAQRVIDIRPDDREAAYERAIALFELCRFREAKSAFLAMKDDPERSAHAHHHLGLLLEREGKWKEADKEFALAHEKDPEEFPAPDPIAPEEFRREVDKAVGALPEDMRRDLQGIPVTVEELPRDDDLLSGDPPLSPSILGLFRGPSLGERCDGTETPCRSVALYRRNLARAVRSRSELLEQIRVTLLHEVGHLRGEDDFELAARGLE